MTLQPMLLALALALAAPLAQAQVSAEPAPTRFDAADTNDDGKVDRTEYDGFVQELVLLYDTDGDSKLANVLFTRELHRRFHGLGINAVSFHPGGIATNFANDTTSPMRFVYHSPIARLLTSVETGGARLTWLVDGTPGSTWQPGGYYERNRPGRVNPQARDDGLAEGLWARSEALLGL